jgi:hypothetical protein
MMSTPPGRSTRSISEAAARRALASTTELRSVSQQQVEGGVEARQVSGVGHREGHVRVEGARTREPAEEQVDAGQLLGPGAVAQQVAEDSAFAAAHVQHPHIRHGQQVGIGQQRQKGPLATLVKVEVGPLQ